VPCPIAPANDGGRSTEALGTCRISWRLLEAAESRESGLAYYGATMKKNVWRAVAETGFIIFLFYSNLLMGEFERSGMGRERGLTWALGDIFTGSNFGIAVVSALMGYGLIEFVRNRL
jgi:hypothetical protein